MKYKYVSRTKQGELQTGMVEGADREVAFNILSSHELVVLSLEDAGALPWYLWIAKFFKRVKPQEVMVFTRQFATLLEAQIPLSEAMKNLYRQTQNSTLKEAVVELTSDIDAGLLLSQALERHSDIFSSFYVNMVRSAEVTGRLQEAIGFLADYLEKEVGLLSKVRNALIYPTIVVVLFVVVGGIVVGVVFPQLAPIFSETNVQLPFLTRVLLGSGEFLSRWWVAVVIFLVTVILMVADYAKSKEGHIVFDELKVRLPVISDLYRKMYIARLAESAAVLIKGGVPIAQSLEIAGNTIGNIVYKDRLRAVAELVRGGQLMSQALREQEEYFPPLVSQMVAVGEATGRLEELFSRIARFYTREVDDAVSNLIELIQPVLIAGIGILVGILFAAVLLPIYNLSQTF